MPLMRIGFHYVPKYRPIANWHHGLGSVLRLFTQSRPKAPAKNHNLHQGQVVTLFSLKINTNQKEPVDALVLPVPLCGNHNVGYIPGQSAPADAALSDHQVIRVSPD